MKKSAETFVVDKQPLLRVVKPIQDLFDE